MKYKIRVYRRICYIIIFPDFVLYDIYSFLRLFLLAINAAKKPGFILFLTCRHTLRLQYVLFVNTPPYCPFQNEVVQFACVASGQLLPNLELSESHFTHLIKI